MLRRHRPRGLRHGRRGRGRRRGAVCQVVNLLNANSDSCRWWFDEEAGVVRGTQEIYDAVGDDFGAYAFYYMNNIAMDVYYTQAEFLALVG